MKKVKLVIFVLLITISTTSCWSRREIENLGFVLGLGVSKTEEGLYTVVLQVANPKMVATSAPDQRDVYTIMKAEGLTVFDALRNLSTVAGRRLYLSHIKALIIHESIAKEGVSEIIGFLVQDMEVRLEMDVYISKLPPEDIFDTPNTLGSIPAMVLDVLAKNYGANSKVYIADLHETVEASNNSVVNFVTALIDREPSPTDKEKTMFKINETAVFDNDKLVGYFDYEVGQGYNFITNNFKGGLIIFECGKSGDMIVLEVLESKAAIKPQYTESGIGFDIELKVDANVAERVPSSSEFHELDIEEINKQFNQVLEAKLMLAIDAAQNQFKVDYFNLSSYFHRRFPKEFRELKQDWNKYFTKADINVKVESTIIHSALNQNKGRF